jgi:hypothetical protein
MVPPHSDPLQEGESVWDGRERSNGAVGMAALSMLSLLPCSP